MELLDIKSPVKTLIPITHFAVDASEFNGKSGHFEWAKNSTPIVDRMNKWCIRKFA